MKIPGGNYVFLLITAIIVIIFGAMGASGRILEHSGRKPCPNGTKADVYGKCRSTV